MLGGAIGSQPWEDRGCVFERMGLNHIKVTSISEKFLWDIPPDPYTMCTSIIFIAL